MKKINNAKLKKMIAESIKKLIKEASGTTTGFGGLRKGTTTQSTKKAKRKSSSASSDYRTKSADYNTKNTDYTDKLARYNTKGADYDTHLKAEPHRYQWTVEKV